MDGIKFEKVPVPSLDVLPALRAALSNSAYEDIDKAAVTLALKLANVIDRQVDAKIIADLSTKLLAVLTALRMTPAARASVVKGAANDGSDAQSTLASLRNIADARRIRLHSAETVDAGA